MSRSFLIFQLFCSKRSGGKCVGKQKRIVWRNVFRMRECARQVPFHQIPPKSHATHIPSSGKVHQDIRFASFALSAGSSVKQNRRENRKAARLEDLIICKTFRPRLCFPQPVYSLTSLLKRPENSPISRNFLRRGRLWTADFGWGLAKLGVPRRDVETGGEIV